MKLALLHTSALHVPTFNNLLEQTGFESEPTHVVREDLLERARTNGVTPELAAELDAVLASLDADLILCTCSTLGGLAEAHGEHVLRVDRPLAAEAVRLGPRVVVLATLKSTLSATRALLEEEAAKVPHQVDIRLEVCAEAWPYFEAGDLSRYHRAVAACLERLAPAADALVLAQASMAGAETLTNLEVPVLSSPTLGVQAALKRLA